MAPDVADFRRAARISILLAWVPRGGRATRALLLIGVTLVGAVLRLWGVLHGFREGYVYHPDALIAVHDSWQHLLGASWLEGRFGAVQGVLLWAALWVVDAIGRFAGYPFAWTFEGIAGVMSLLSATLGTATIPAVYVLGARAYGTSAGLLAAALLAVAPLHVVQSHYPYRDTPMVFLLVLSLAASLMLAARPGLPWLGIAVLAAGVTAAAKPAGALAVVPLAVAGVLAVTNRRRRSVVLIAGVLLGAGAIAVLPLVGLRTVRAAQAFLRRLGDAGFLDQAGRHVDTFVAWAGLPFLFAVVAAVAYALWRRRPADLVLTAFLLPAAVATARYRFIDERFHLFLLPAACVLLASAIVDGWRRSPPPRWLLRLALAILTVGLVVTGAGRSAWYGRLLALPDTRSLAGGWFEAHVPRTTRIAMEEYYPLGINEWPNARGLNTSKPLATELADTDVLVTSSIEHQRYFDNPSNFPTQFALLSALPGAARLVKRVTLFPLGFLHPVLDVYWTRPPGVSPPVRLALPRPYDHRWNRGVSLLETGAYDRDDRTIWLGGGQRDMLTMASPEPIDEALAIVLNGPAPSRLRLELGWARREVPLVPSEWRLLRFRPRWLLPYRPALYPVVMSLRPEGSWAQVQWRVGAREIGEALAGWGQWEAAVPYLERANRAHLADVETGLLLAAAYRHVRRADAGQVVLEGLAAQSGRRLAEYRRLTDRALGASEWERIFADLTGLDPAWLPQALAQDLEAEDLVLKAGRRLGDADASGDRSVVFDRARDGAGLLVNGPIIFLQPAGAYRASVRLRAWNRSGGRSVAIVRVYAERRLLAERTVIGAELGPSDSYAEIALPYVHAEPRDRVAFQVEATGGASLALDRIRVAPDLRANLERQLGEAFGTSP
jgi:Dolichyl-phosphate-mannose-protein mannosyltransferase